MGTVQRAFALAAELRSDPFAIKRTQTETPEALTPLFDKHSIDRANLTAKAMIGFGQVRCQMTFNC